MSRVAMAMLVLVAACSPVKAPADECTTAAQCTDPALPFCIDTHCVARCGGDSDCGDPDRPVCASDGVCVGCQDATDCSVAAPVCDAATHACRGCSAESECAGGICIDADGVCAADVAVAFVTQMGADTGTCPRAAPCATITYALGQLGERHVIHVLGGSLNTATVILKENPGLVLDGEDTTLNAGNAATLGLQDQADATVEGFRLNIPTNVTGVPVPAISVTGPAHARFHDVQIEGSGGIALATSLGAQVAIAHAHVGSLSASSSNQISCSGSKVSVSESVLDTTIVGGSGSSCELTVTRNRFESSFDGSVQISDGQLLMENNLIIHRDGFNDSILATGLRPGSTIRFNTIVNTTALSSDGAALSCDTSVLVTSNVFAYNSGHPITGTGCQTRFSVFDDKATTGAGTGNHLTGIEQIFVNRSGGDYHLAPASVARAAAEPGLDMVTTDFEGSPRPSPAGTTADCGAFEAP